MIGPAGWLRRRQTGGMALGLYTLLALAMMSPLAPGELPVTGACDICNHVSGIIEARHALHEHQFPIRVPPHQNNCERYALFQFYGNLPYTAGAVVYRYAHVNPYTAWKIIVTGCLVLGGFFTYRAGRTLTRHALPAVAAGVVFITAPYLLTDIHGRVAYSEIVSFALLPVVFYYAWRSFAGRGPGAVLGSGVAWCCLALTHNITYLYGSMFLGLFFLSYLALRRRLVARWCRVGAGYALGLVLAAWYIVPQQVLMPTLCDGLLTSVWDAAWLTPIGVLLAPSVALPVHLGSRYIAMPEHFGLQIGWPILAAVGLALYGLRQPNALGSGRRATLVRLLAFFGLAFFMTWSPVNFWPALPALFSYVQFSYRLLMFVVLFGSLLAAYALMLALEGKMRAIHLAAVVLIAGWCAAPYLSPHHGDLALSVDKEIAAPNIGRGGACAFFRPGAPCLAATSLVHPGVDWVDYKTGGLLDSLQNLLHGKVWAVLPPPGAGDVLLLEGNVAPTPTGKVRLTIALDDGVLANPELPPGPFKLELPLPPAPGKERVCVVVHGEPIKIPMEPPHPRPQLQASYGVSKFALAPNPVRPTALAIMPSTEALAHMSWGHPSVLHVRLTERTLVQLPVAYYPEVLRVEHNGQRVGAQHLGRFVALELAPGEHKVEVRFEGVRWANYLSLASWSALAAAGLWLAARPLWRRRRMSLPQGVRRRMDRQRLAA